jgi:hypothetical protein
MKPVGGHGGLRPNSGSRTSKLALHQVILNLRQAQFLKPDRLFPPNQLNPAAKMIKIQE